MIHYDRPRDNMPQHAHYLIIIFTKERDSASRYEYFILHFAQPKRGVTASAHIHLVIFIFYFFGFSKSEESTGFVSQGVESMYLQRTAVSRRRGQSREV